MISKASTAQEYIDTLPEYRKVVMQQLRSSLLENLPEGFEEQMQYGMIGYVVPHSIYPDGYHCKPEIPLPFINLASQKNHIALYHSGIYASPQLKDWFTEEYAKRGPTKLDMGKSCIQFKKPEHVPLKLIQELAIKMTVKQWVETYERVIKNSNNA